MAQPQDTTVNKTAHAFERNSLESLLIRRFFYAPAFEIYGGESFSTELFDLSTNPRTLSNRCKGSLRLREYCYKVIRS